MIDLDAGIPAGLGWELAACALRARPAAGSALAAAALRGGGALERAACAVAGVDLGTLPLDPGIAAAIRAARAEGRPLLLMTAAHPALARALAAGHPGAGDVLELGRGGGEPGDAVGDLARTAGVRARCPGGFVVPGRMPAGEPAPPLPAWARTAAPYPAGGPPVAPAPSAPERPASPASALRLWARALRLHQWAKNLLVFVPPVLAGQALEPRAWAAGLCAFLAFGLVASATYLLNDLHDLPHDRAHRSKRHRPLAAGALPIPAALAAAGLGLAGGAALAAASGGSALLALSAYLALTLAYTFGLKRLVVVDAAALAALFTLRLAGGIAFCGVAGSAWLLVLSMFTFTSLALAKRLIEIEGLGRGGTEPATARLPGRGYRVGDAPVVLALGAAASTAAVLIFSLYIVEAAARQTFYATPDLLWGAPVALFVFLGRIWVLCGRGALRDDPVAFALTDRPSLGLGLLVALSFALACLRF